MVKRSTISSFSELTLVRPHTLEWIVRARSDVKGGKDIMVRPYLKLMRDKMNNVHRRTCLR